MSRRYIICPNCKGNLNYVVIRKGGLDSVYRFDGSELSQEVEGDSQGFSGLVCPRCNTKIADSVEELKKHKILDESGAVAEAL